MRIRILFLLFAFGPSLLDDSVRSQDKQSPAAVSNKARVLFDFYGLKQTPFDDLRTATRLPYHNGDDFGKWRDPDPKRIQWIEYGIRHVTVPNHDNESCLAFFYSLTGRDTANGLDFKLHGEDLSAYSGGDLILRMCQLPELTQEKGGDLPTNTLIVELKWLTPKGEVLESQLQQTFSRDLARMQKNHGFFDVRIPLADFGDIDGKIDLSEGDEIVITLNSQLIPSGMKKGVLGLQAIVLTETTHVDNGNRHAIAAGFEQVSKILAEHRTNQAGE